MNRKYEQALREATERVVELEAEYGSDKTSLIENNKRLQALVNKQRDELHKHRSKPACAHITNNNRELLLANAQLTKELALVKEEREQLLHWLHVFYTSSATNVILPDEYARQLLVDNSPTDPP